MATSMAQHPSFWVRFKQRLRRSTSLPPAKPNLHPDPNNSQNHNALHHTYSTASHPLPSPAVSATSVPLISRKNPSHRVVPSSSPQHSRFSSVDNGSATKTPQLKKEKTPPASPTEDPPRAQSRPNSPDAAASTHEEPRDTNVVATESDRHPSELVDSPPPSSGSTELPTSLAVDPPPPTSSLLLKPTPYEPTSPRGREQPALTPTVGEPLFTNPLSENPSAPIQLQPVPATSVSFSKRPSLGIRRQSLLATSNQQWISSLLEPGASSESGPPTSSQRVAAAAAATMIPRKIWVKRPGGSATLVPTTADALVDEVRDQVIMKYANSLGKTFDAPDITIRIVPREGANKQATPDRSLSPEESLVTVVDAYYPGGQTVEEALVIDMPQRRTPKPSPRHNIYYHHSEPGEHGEYFPLMPVNASVPTPPTHPNNSTTSVNAHQAPAISIINTGKAPLLPSPGSRGSRHPRRPPLTRHTTNSPTMLGSASGPKESVATPSSQPAPPVPSPPGPPAPESPQNKVLTPPARVASPRPRPSKPKKSNSQSLSAAFGGLIEGTVPPINVLIVEDNVINQRLLEAFMKRLSVRWKCAANGQEAVQKWQQGGFHLVLMDIQLPVMNGLDATKEIRRLERLNGIGVFPKTASGRSSAASANATSPAERDTSMADPLKEEDTLQDLSLFKSPVIIVALTASSLQSDRHEALAAGCNDFLTKPVRFEWLEQKVTEWGCMQALIDFEGWRKWRGFVDDTQAPSPVSDGPRSPMQIGTEGGSRKPSPAMPPTPTPAPGSSKPNGTSIVKPTPTDTEQDDSSGNGSSGIPDSPASPPVSTGPVDEPTDSPDV
ncbi:Two-component response regulator SSK1p [Aspergillus melleus]|uniref:Two-component response regulator SSK1p n=1 Tax=Aspergillus melleus TaxID=138277 RepID=A0ACC3B2K9_9EURO|nr:Two-component response regulator SSK1p [Aspergillus melleus]